MTDTRRNYRGRALARRISADAQDHPAAPPSRAWATPSSSRAMCRFLARAGARCCWKCRPSSSPLSTLAGAAAVHARGETLARLRRALPARQPTAGAQDRGREHSRRHPLSDRRGSAPRALASHAGSAAGQARRLCLGRTSPAHPNDRNRSIDLKLWGPLLAREGISFVSIQRDLRDDDAARLAASHASPMSANSSTTWPTPPR